MEAIFNNILNQMAADYTEISAGNMMRSPAICYKSKVFAFYYKERMVFKLDANAAQGILDYPGSEYRDYCRRVQ